MDISCEFYPVWAKNVENMGKRLFTPLRTVWAFSKTRNTQQRNVETDYTALHHHFRNRGGTGGN
jgi:hypothetical protein